MDKSYRTIEHSAVAEFIERRSRFIGYASPVTTEQQALDFIAQIRSKHWDATHNVYAYCLREGQIRRYSDDGEPSGTAGVPTLDVILKSNLTDIVVVGTRYFGGVLLGAGGLVRAYSHSASIAIEEAKIITRSLCSFCKVACEYNQYGKVSSTVCDYGSVVDNSLFLDKVEVSFHIPCDSVNALNKALADVTCGEVKVEVEYQDFCTEK